MRKRKIPENLIEQASAFNETDDEEILKARQTFKELMNKYEDKIKEEKEKVIEARRTKNNRNRKT